VPTGTADPFGLRRQALGIIRITVEKKYPFSLRELIEESEKTVEGEDGADRRGSKKRRSRFLSSPISNFLLERRVPFDVTEAVLTVSFDELPDVQGRIDALQKAREWEGF